MGKQAPSNAPESKDGGVVAMKKKERKKIAAAAGSTELSSEADTKTPSKTIEIEAKDELTVVRKKTRKRKRSLAESGVKEVEAHSPEVPEGKRGVSEADLEVMKSHKLFEQGVMPPKIAKKKQQSEIKKTDRKGEDVEHPAIDRLRIFIGGFPRCTPREERVTAVRERFERFGELTEVEVPLDSKKQCMGMAFVSYTNEKAVAKAMSQSGTELLGVTIEVKPAFVPRKKKSPRNQAERDVE